MIFCSQNKIKHFNYLSILYTVSSNHNMGFYIKTFVYIHFYKCLMCIIKGAGGGVNMPTKSRFGVKVLHSRGIDVIE